jgi:hypothetical protein
MLIIEGIEIIAFGIGNATTIHLLGVHRVPRDPKNE